MSNQDQSFKVKVVFTGTVQKDVQYNNNELKTPYRWCGANVISINGEACASQPVLVQVYESTRIAKTVDPLNESGLVYDGVATILGKKVIVNVTPIFNTTSLTTADKFLQVANGATFAKEEVLDAVGVNTDDLPF